MSVIWTKPGSSNHHLDLFEMIDLEIAMVGSWGAARVEGGLEESIRFRQAGYPHWRDVPPFQREVAALAARVLDREIVDATQGAPA